MAKKILFDMDGTLAMFYKNPSCLEAMYEPGYFKYLEPYTNPLIAAKMLVEQGYEVGIISACVTPVCKEEKRYWLKYFFPEADKNFIFLCDVGENKADVLEKNGFRPEEVILIDDYTKNCTQWKESGGTAIKIINEINGKNGIWNGLRFCYESTPEDICSLIREEADSAA